MSYTPGPWRVLHFASENKGFIAVVAGEKDHVCDVFPFGARAGSSEREMEQHKANACLIAAAPDLLAALEAVRPIVARDGDGPDDQAVFNLLCEAIAKATQS